MILDDVSADVSSQLDQQADLGVQITVENDVPETGPTNRGLWIQIPNATAVFADLKGSTDLNATEGPEVAAVAYTYFIRAMTVILDRFGARYLDIHGDGVFGLFSGKDSEFLAAACAITMRTHTEREIAVRFEADTSASWELSAGFGIDKGTLLVRRLGLRGTKQNEVWAGTPLNSAAKLSSVAAPDQVVVSDRVYAGYESHPDHPLVRLETAASGPGHAVSLQETPSESASKLRRRALIWSCGCERETVGTGFEVPIGQTSELWGAECAPRGLGLDFENCYRLKSAWCINHGPEFCEVLVTGKRSGR